MSEQQDAARDGSTAQPRRGAAGQRADAPGAKAPAIASDSPAGPRTDAAGSPAAHQHWYRSFYWRIAIGFIVCVAVLLVAQALLFVWMAERAGMPLLARSPEHLATVVASDLSAALDTDPKLDMQDYIKARFSRRTPQVVVVMKDGRLFHSGTNPPPDGVVRWARFRLQRGGPFDRPLFTRPPFGTFRPRGPGMPPPAGEGSRREAGRPDAAGNSTAAGGEAGRSRTDQSPDQGGHAGRDRDDDDAEADALPPPGGARPDAARPDGARQGAGFGPGAGGPRRALTGPIVVDGDTIGLVVVLPGGAWPFAALREFGPTLAMAGVVLLLLGTATMAFFVFQPARRRLRALEEAADRIGAGDTSARAPVEGGDEVTALAATFNRMAAELDARVRELQEVDRARRQLLADVSHELMTPLTAIRGYLETLALPAAVKDDETRDKYLQIVTDETLRLEAIIGDLLDLARLEGGGAGAMLQREVVPVGALFARAAERHGPRLAERGVTIEMHIDPGADQVAGDGRRLEQAVQNLVANAVRHTPRGGRIELSSTVLDSHVRLRVRDTGPGIAPEHLSRVFDRFYRVDAARDQASGGSGLGLSIVRAIVDAHGGTITAAAAPGGGAMFDIMLPRPAAANGGHLPNAAPGATSAVAPGRFVS